jgi:hypothetical protein
VADGYHGGVHVAHAVAPTESAHPQKEHHDEEHTALQLHEAVVRDCRGEEVLAAAENVVNVEMFEALVPSEVEHQLHGHYLAVGHGRLAAATLLARGREEVFLKLGVEIFAEFVHGTENFSNFVVGNHKDCIFIIILIYNYKDTNFLVITFSFSDKVINKVIPNSRLQYTRGYYHDNKKATAQLQQSLLW